LKNSSVLPTIYVIGFFAFASQSLVFPVMPLYATQLGASVSEVGLIVALVAYFNAAFMIPFGLLSDRFGRRTFLIAGFIIATISTLLYTLTTNILQLSILRAIHGIGLAAQTPTILATVLDLSPEEQRGKALGWITTATQTGLMAGPVIGGVILNSFGFTIAFISCSIFSLIGMVVLLARFSIIPREKKTELSVNKSWQWLKQPPLYGGMLTTFAIAMGIGTLGAYIPIYGEGLGITAAGAGLIITLSFAGSAMLRVQTGTLSDKLGRKPLIIFGLILGAAMMALILLSILAFCFGIGIASVQPSSMALIADLSPRGAKGLASGMFTCAYQIGNAVGPTAMGVVAGISNLETMFLACGSSIAFMLVVIIILFKAR
jgi:MFS family permease